MLKHPYLSPSRDRPESLLAFEGWVRYHFLPPEVSPVRNSTTFPLKSLEDSQLVILTLCRPSR